MGKSVRGAVFGTTTDFMMEPVFILQILIFLVVAWVFVRHGESSMFHPATTYLAFHCVVFVVRPILAYYLNFDHTWRYIGFFPKPSDLLTTFAVTSLALAVFV